MSTDKPKFNIKSFGYGIGIGLINTAIFNPIDKALYSSVVYKTSIFTKQNWIKPYSGLKEASIGRILSYGMYFPIMDFYKCSLNAIENEKKRLVLASSFTGTTLAIITNPLTVTKIQNWNNPHTNVGLFKLGSQLYSQYGLSKFARGIQYTIIRENIFSITYIMLNNTFNKDRSFGLNIICGIISTSLAAPINYVRNMVFSRPLSEPTMKFSTIVKHLLLELKDKPNKISYLCFNKFLIGWGTLRVALGMAFSDTLYLYFSKN